MPWRSNKHAKESAPILYQYPSGWTASKTQLTRLAKAKYAQTRTVNH